MARRPPDRRKTKGAPRKTKRGPRKAKRAPRKGKPAAGRGRGTPQVSRRARRVAQGFVAASEAPAEAVAGDAGEGVRLNKWLAQHGVDSRRKCDEMVLEGAVTVNGEPVLEPGRRIRGGDEVRVDGARIEPKRRLYYVFYKPRGVLCTNDPRETRTRVCDLVDPMVPGRIYPVGRLDEDSEGLLLLTNDGDFANLVAHPRYGVPKTYVCQIGGPMSTRDVEKVRGGAWIDGGRVRPERVRVMRRTQRGATLEITIREGRNREVRRLLARHGFGVKRLKRVRIGPLGMKGVKRGQVRPLARAERDAVVQAARDRGRGSEGKDA